MTQQRSCTECGGTEHYSKEVNAGAESLPVGSMHGAKYRVVVCGACGYTRWYVPERFLSLVKERYDAAQ